MKRLVLGSLLGLALLFGTCITLVDWSTLPTSEPRPSMAEEWLSGMDVPAGTPSVAFFRVALTVPGVDAGFVASSRASFRRHHVTFPDGSKLETGWNVEASSLILEYIVALP